MLPATYDGEDQGRSCNKLTDFGLHTLDPQSSFLALSVFFFPSCTDFSLHRLDPQSFFLTSLVWVLGFFFSFFSVVPISASTDQIHNLSSLLHRCGCWVFFFFFFSCTDCSLHRLDPKSFFLALSVWVLVFFFFFSQFWVVKVWPDPTSLNKSHTQLYGDGFYN